MATNTDSFEAVDILAAFDPDPLTVIPDDEGYDHAIERDEHGVSCCVEHAAADLTDIATHASGVWLTALVVAAGAFFVAAYVWSRSS